MITTTDVVDQGLMQNFINQVRCYRVPVMPVGYEDAFLEDRIIQAVRDTPRHLFAENFTVGENQEFVYGNTDREFLKQVYSTQSLIYNIDGETVPASNSEPRFILHLLNLLDVQKGESVLEVGAGAGWLTALISRLVGPSGFVTGIEVIDRLSDSARRNLRRLDITNVDIVTDNVLRMEKMGRHYDKIIFTASVFSIPEPVFDALNVGGVLGLPIRNIGNSEEFYFLGKTNEHSMRSFASRGARFVPVVGGDIEDYTGVRRPNKNVRTLMQREAVCCEEMDFHKQSPKDLLNWTMGYTRRMSKMIGSRFTAWDLADDAPETSLHALAQRPSELAFGVEGPKGSSLAIWRNNQVKGYGESTLAARDMRFMIEVFNAWVADRRPFGFQWGLDVRKSSDGADFPERWAERRGAFDLIWKP